MSKEYLEAIDNAKLSEAWITIYHYNDEIIHNMGSEYVENPLKEELDIVNNALLELKAIKEAKPSEALKCLDKMYDTHILKNVYCYHTIKQYILKAQEQEKVLSIIKEKNVDFDTLTDSEALDDYNSKMNWSYRRLTQEEFDLLKRWLG